MATDTGFRKSVLTRIPAICGAVLTLQGLLLPSGSLAQTIPDQWHSGLHTQHVLAGRIWIAAENRFISHEELVSLLSATDYLLLGEKHDNPDHHRLRLELLQTLLQSQQPSLLVMEMITTDQQSAVDALASSEPLPASDQWPALLDWDEGWTWTFYQPLIDLAISRNARMLAGNISADNMMQIYRSTQTSQTAQVLSPAQLDRLAREIDLSHCGMLPESQIPAMVRVQQARDRQMADALTSSGQFRQRILVAGNYHIRYDVSVPNYLAAAQTDSSTPVNAAGRMLNLAFLEVDPALTEPQAYVADAGGQRVYDLVWFTPAVRADDYCADMTAQ